MTNDKKKKGYQGALIEATFLAREENICLNSKSKTKEDWTASWKKKKTKTKGTSSLYSTLIPFSEGNYLSPDQIFSYEKWQGKLLVIVQSKT